MLMNTNKPQQGTLMNINKTQRRSANVPMSTNRQQISTNNRDEHKQNTLKGANVPIANEHQ